MKSLHFALRRDLSRYVHGELSVERVRGIEDHLLDCASCRLLLSRIKTGSNFIQSASRASLERDPWLRIDDRISAGVETTSQIKTARSKLGGSRQNRLIRVGLAVTLAALIVSLAAAVVLYGRLRLTGANASPGFALDEGEFHPVSISGIDRSTRAHVVAEGYVSEVKVNDEDGDLSFKLVEDLGRPNPFIVCEIIDTIKLEPPRVGSRVKVYGVSRYDAESNHQWYEVHPVLSIEVVPHHDK